jgi:hypothetical protein
MTDKVPRLLIVTIGDEEHEVRLRPVPKKLHREPRSAGVRRPLGTPLNQSHKHRCPSCKGQTLVWNRLGGEGGPRPVMAWACADCGYAEFPPDTWLKLEYASPPDSVGKDWVYGRFPTGFVRTSEKYLRE